MDDDYELLPHQELERLREENTRLRQNPFKGRAEPHDLQGSLDRLTVSIEKLMKFLSQTNDEMLSDYKKISLHEQFANISKQNEQIAQGILTVADMLQQMKNPQSQQPAQPDMMQSPVAGQIPSGEPLRQDQMTQQAMQQGMQSASPAPAQPMPAEQAPQGQPAMPPPAPGQAPPPQSSFPEPSVSLPPPPPEKKKGFSLFKK